MAKTHLSYSDFRDIYGDLGVTEWTKYNWLADYWKELTPAGFERVQYLESTGTQYIDTGVNAKNGYNLKFTASFAEGSNKIFSGAQSYIAPNYYRAFGPWSRDKSGTKYNLGLGSGGAAYGDTIYNNDQIYNFEVNIDATDPYLSVDGTKADLSNVAEAFNTHFPDLAIWIYALHNESSSNYAYFIGKSYGVIELSVGGDLVQYLIPMIRTSDNKPGLYDLVNHQFLTNSGTGEFIAGPPVDYTIVQYLQSDGNQWIDTGLYGGIDTVVKLKVKQLTNSTNNTITPFGDNEDTNAAISLNFSTVDTPRNTRFGDQVVSVASQPLNTDLTITINQDNLTINGSVIGTFNTTNDFSTLNTMTVFRVNNIGSVYNDCIRRVYYCNISDYETQEPTMILIPTLDPHFTPCLYDLITRTPFYNQGTGEFTYQI